MNQQSTGTMSEATPAGASAAHVHVRYEGRKARFLPYLSPVALVRDLWRHRALLHQLSKSQFSAGHREDFLGKGWLVLEPLAMLAVYSLVFIVILGFSSEGGPLASVLGLYAGIVTYQMFAQALSTSANLIRGAHGYVKLMVFPTQVLPGSIVGGLVVPGFIGYGLVLLVAAIGGLPVKAVVLLLPIVLIPMYVLVLGLSWILSALCVFIPDMRTMTTILIRFAFFLTPVVYPLKRLEGTPFHTLLMLNPLTAIIEGVRDVLVRHEGPNWLYLAIVTAGALVLCQIAYAFFMRSKRWFADVL
jgi:lipopolysaccharide transport system permease protein